MFDAYKVKGGQGSVEKYHDIHVVYTKEAETADTYIERATYEIGRRHRVRVATSDGPEQLIILGHGALRLSASAFRQEVEQVEGQIADILAANNRRQKTGNVRSALERARMAAFFGVDQLCLSDLSSVADYDNYNLLEGLDAGSSQVQI